MTSRVVVLATVLLSLPLLAFAQPTWIGEDLPYDYPQATGVNTADLNMDGDLELLVTSQSAGIDVWRFDGDQWLRDVVYSGTGGADHASAANLDDDPEPEIIGSCSDSDRLILCDSTGDGWTTTVIDATTDYLYHHDVADLDLDGDLDIVGSVYLNDQVRWWENDGNGGWTSHVVGTVSNVVRSMVADMNNDGEPDIVSASYSDNTVMLFTNTGGAIGWTVDILASGYDAAYGLLPADVDNDGDMDLFATADDSHEIHLLHNELPGWTDELIATGWNGARDMVWVDVDGGGVKDLVCAAHWNGIAWFEGEAGWTRHDVEYDAGAGYSEIVVADLDGDNDLDIASDAWYGGFARAWIMEGAGGPVQLNLTLQNAPVTLPPDGGELLFDVHLTSELPFAVPGLTGITTIELPNGQMFGPLLQQALTLPAYADLSIFNIAQVVPALAPSGTYHYYAYLGLNEQMFVSDNFQFSKQAAMPAGGGEPVRLNRPANPPVEGTVSYGAGVPVVEVPQRTSRAPVDFNPADWPVRR